jgi:chromosome segregation ATPase
MENTELVVVEQLNVMDVFTGNSLDPLLAEIEAKAKGFTPTVEHAKGRKQIASMAYKVSQSKVVLDKLGKELVADMKAKVKKVDSERKKARDHLDALRDEVRQPLTEWEEAEAAREAAEKLAKEIEEAHEAALAEHALYLRQKEIEAKEAELARQEEERRQKEEAERLERERIEREAQLRREAEGAARKKAEEEAQAKILEAERKEREAREAAEKAERDRVAAEERAKVEREMAVKEAERKAKEEAERIERERLEAEAKRKAEEEARQADIEHKKKINNAALAAFVANGIGKEQAKQIVTLVAKGLIDNVKIVY